VALGVAVGGCSMAAVGVSVGKGNGVGVSAAVGNGIGVKVGVGAVLLIRNCPIVQ